MILFLVEKFVHLITIVVQVHNLSSLSQGHGDEKFWATKVSGPKESNAQIKYFTLPNSY